MKNKEIVRAKNMKISSSLNDNGDDDEVQIITASITPNEKEKASVCDM